MTATATYPTKHHQHLAALAGEWEGPAQTWFDPDSAPKDAMTKGRIREIAQGNIVLFEYESSLDGEPFFGAFFLGYDENRKKFVASWVDSFHSSTALMQCEGDESPGALINVLGSYDAGGEKWGWRTVFRLEAPDHLVYQAFNIFPDGTEYKGIETHLRRKG